MYEWDDNELPLAYMITFRTYGTWLWGDERGSVDRYNNKFGAPRIVPNNTKLEQHRTRLKSDPVFLDSSQRAIVEAAIREVCDHRKWVLRAINVRTNHVHVAPSIGTAKAANALRDFKAYSTRALRQHGLWNHEHGPWSDGGSERYLWKESEVNEACYYITDMQGPDLR